MFAGIISGRYYCIQSEQIARLLPCADKPSRQELAEILKKAMLEFRGNFGEPYDSAIKRTAPLILKKKPDINWQLLLLA